MLRIERFCRTRAALILGVAVALVIALSISLPTAAAAPSVTRTTPLDGEILQRTPTAVGVGFDTALDRQQSTFRLLTPEGTEVEGTTLSWGSGDSSVTINLPRTFSDGVYTITWHAVSADDGESTDGWTSFSVGNPEDANIITIPSSASGHSDPPHWLQAASRWLALTGIAATLAIWPMWRGVIRPTLAVNRAAGVRSTLRMQRWAAIALAIALAGSLTELVVHAQVDRSSGVLDATMQALGNSDWGFWWLVRMVVLVLLGIGFAISPWWFPGRSRLKNAMLWTLSLLLPVPLVLSGRAIDDEVGRVTTTIVTYLHTLSLGMWVGGAFTIALMIGVFAGNDSARRVLKPRIGWLTITCWAMLGLTGLYLTWLYAGNRDAMLDTDFGRTLSICWIIAVVTLVLALMMMWRMNERTGMASSMLPAVALLSVVLVLFGARLDVLVPARAVLTERSVQTSTHLSFDGRPGLLLVAPGRSGVNHLRLETPGTYLQTETQVYLDISSVDYPELGTKAVPMYRVQGNAYEHHGTEFSLIGDWNISVRIEEPGFPSSQAATTHAFGEENTSVTVPSAPWKFEDMGGVSGIALAVVGIAGLATALFTSSSNLRKEAGGLAIVAAALAAVVIVQGRVDPILVVESGEGAINPNDLVMVARGAETYNQMCASCHGTGLRGDGPLSEALSPPPTDFSAPHARVHSHADLIYWIQYGIQGTAMPGFNSQLSDQDIRDIIAYILNWQQLHDGSENAAGTPSTGVCEIAPTDFVGIREIFGHGLHPETRRGTPLVRAADSTVPPERTNEVMWTLEQMVNCANEDQFLSQIRLYTPELLNEIFPQGASYEVTNRATAAPRPLGPDEMISIQDVQSITLLADGRIAVTVIFSDPTGVGVIPGANPVYQVTLILVNRDGVWMIDEVR